jgi:hypothetical protein
MLDVAIPTPKQRKHSKEHVSEQDLRIINNTL